MGDILDGTGSGQKAKVSGNRLFSHSITESESLHATESGNSYNINTGPINLTSSTVSGVLYLVNNEDSDLIIESIVVGIGSAGTTTDSTYITLIQNPDSVSFSASVDMNINRNFGSSKTLNATVYKGAEGATVTGGTEGALFFQPSGGRLFAPIGFVLTKGSSVALKIDTNTSSGTTIIYAALVLHLKNSNFEG